MMIFYSHWQQTSNLELIDPKAENNQVVFTYPNRNDLL